MPRLSVIVAVYNMANYLEKCCTSLFGQTLKDIEYIFVDDCSNDGSMDVVKRVLSTYPSRTSQVKIVCNERNSGVAYSRGRGMKMAVGNYIIHCDPDDYIDLNYYEQMIKVGEQSGADIVACDYIRHVGERSSHIKNNFYSDVPSDCIKHIDECYFFPALWCIMLKRSLIQKHDIYPIVGINTGEDLNVLLRAFYYGNEICYIPKAFYHYICRPGSLSQNRDSLELWNKNISKNLDYLIRFFDKPYDKTYRRMLAYLVFTKKMFLLSARPPQYKRWFNSYSYYNRYILSLRGVSISRRLFYWLIAHFYPLGWAYYKIKR